MDESFDFKIPTGQRVKLTIPQARSFGCVEMNKRCDEIVAELKKNKAHKKDSFVPGWQENIRMYITCPFQYRRALKDLGLIEIGYDYIPQQKEVSTNVFTPEMVEHAVRELKIDLSGSEIDAMESGEFFKE